ncbi:MAG: HIT family protein [Archaeoglobaceae archaeon]
MGGCIFCKIAGGEIPAEKIYETENSIAFLDINPRSPGHTLVIPKEHVESLRELDDNRVSDIFNTTRDVMNLLKKALDPDGFNVGINDGAAAGQEIPHLHVNIFPRFSGDDGGPVHAVVNNPPSEEVSETAKKVRSQK